MTAFVSQTPARLRLRRLAIFTAFVGAHGFCAASAAGLGASVGAGAGRGLSAGVSAGGLSAGGSAHAGSTVGVGANASSPVGSTSAGASASAGSTSTGVGASTPAGSAGASAGASAGSTSAAAGGSVGGVSAGAPAGTGGVSASVGASATADGTGRASNVASSPGLAGAAVGAEQQPAGYYALQETATQAGATDLYLSGGTRALSAGQRVQCTSMFCRTHLRRAADHPTRIMIPRDRAERWRTFDDVIVAAEAGNADAEFLVGEVLSGGHGIAPDARRAVVWYTRAAEHGNTLAVARLNRLRTATARDR